MRRGNDGGGTETTGGDANRRPSLARELVAGGASVGIATCITNPIDIVKVRMQMSMASSSRSQRPLMEVARRIVAREGLAGLTGGLSAAVARGVTYGGIRLGLFPPVSAFLGADRKPNVGLAPKMAAAVFTGATAATLTNPMDLLKTQGQVQPGASVFAILRTVVREDGVAGLWRGTLPGATRASILTMAQLVTYSEAKSIVIRHLTGEDGFLTHLSTSMVTGLVATTATNPVDVVKTRVYNKAGSSSVVKCCLGIVKNEGLGAFFKGWTASYLRIGPQTAITFLVYEQMRKLIGLKAL